MTGRDVSRREQAQGVLFSLIMVVSMVGIGAAGFAGSATALQNPDNSNEFASVAVADGAAEEGETGVRIVATTVISQGSSLDGNNLEQVNITFNTALSANNLDAADVAVEVIQPGGTQQDVIGGGSGDVASTTLDTTTIQLDGLQSGTPANIGLNAGDKIRIVSQTNDIDLPSSGNIETSIGVKDDSSNSNTTDTTLELPGPVAVDGTSYSTIQQGLTNVTSNGEVSVGAGQYDGNGSALSVGTSDVLISGSSGAQVVSDGEINANGGTGQLEVNADNVTVDNLEFQGSLIDGRNEPSRAIASTSTTAINHTISNNQFGNFTNKTVVNVEPADSTGNPATTTISSNEFSDIDAIPVAVNTTSTDISNVADNVVIDSNTITLSSGTNDLIQIDDTGGNPNDANVELTDNTLDGPGSSGTGINFGANNAHGSGTVDIDGGSIANVSTGISTGVDGTDLNITDVDISSTGDDAIESSSGVSDLRIDAVTIDGAGTDGIEVTGPGPSNLFEITDGSINNTDSSGAGIDIGTLSTPAVISDVDVTNSGGNAINIEDPTDDVTINSSTFIDQGATGVEVSDSTGVIIDINNNEINGTSTGVDLADLQNSTSLNVTSNTIKNGQSGLNYTETDTTIDDAGIAVHFNKFESNEFGIGIDDGGTNNELRQSFDATFNDFVGNSRAGLDVVNVDSDGSGVVNANYSWWDNPIHSRIVGPYTPQHAESQPLIPRRVYSYTRLHTEGHP